MKNLKIYNRDTDVISLKYRLNTDEIVTPTVRSRPKIERFFYIFNS